MRHRPSAGRKIADVRWQRDKHGKWRLKTEEVDEVEFCWLATREQPGFHKGARVAGRFQSAFFASARQSTVLLTSVVAGGIHAAQADA